MNQVHIKDLLLLTKPKAFNLLHTDYKNKQKSIIVLPLNQIF